MKNIHGGDVYHHPGVLDYSANINPLGTPKAVIEAMTKGMDKLVHYPDIYCEKLREKLGVFHNISVKHIVCGNGAADLIFRLVFALKPKKALVLSPCFAEYEQALKVVGTQVDHYNLNKENFLLTEQFVDALTEDMDMVILCNPNNPTGQLIAPELLYKILECCERKNIFLLLDECFLDFMKEESKYSLLTRAETCKKVFVLRAFTKMYAVPGIRLGYGVCGDEKILEAIYEAGPPWNVSVLAQIAGEVALDEKDYVKRTITLIEQEKQYLYDVFDDLQIHYFKSAANYILFQGSLNWKEELLKKGILIRDCSNYLNLEKGYYRIAVKSHEENITFVKALREVVEQ